jgi:hypothetical protein
MFPHNTSKIDDFLEWMRERQHIYKCKEAGYKKPWTDDVILQDNKFTNVFRQQDKGTVALTEMMVKARDWPVLDQIWNVVWYRLFNHYELASLGPVPMSDRETLYDQLKLRHQQGLKVFTSAHMTTGVAGEAKVDTYIRACEEAVEHTVYDAEKTLRHNLMSVTFEALTTGYLIGRFVAYEIVCDLRFLPIWGISRTEWPIDNETWANMGPGACRGLSRLGLMPLTPLGMPRYNRQSDGVLQMVKLYHLAEVEKIPLQLASRWPFELREIEHSLCEFDKYERIRRGEGQARVKYNGRGE